MRQRGARAYSCGMRAASGRQRIVAREPSVEDFVFHCENEFKTESKADVFCSSGHFDALRLVSGVEAES